MKTFFQKAWPFLFFVTIFLTLFYKVFFFGQILFEGDNFHLNIPQKYFFVQELSKGHLALWNPYLFLGIPAFADLPQAMLYPLNFLYVIFAIPRALSFIVIIDYFGFALGTYLLLRSFSLSKTASVFGALVASLGGMPFALLSNVTFPNVIIYIPFLFLLFQKFCKEKTFRWLLLLVGVQFLQIISGHPQMTYYTMLVFCFYIFFFSKFSFRKKILILGIYIISPAFLASFQLLPFIEYVQHGNRPVGSIFYAAWGSLTLSRLTTFLFPTFYGSHTNGTWWGTQQILIGFLGIPTIVFLYISVRFTEFRDKWFYILGCIAAILLAFGTLTPLFYVFYYVIPGWRFFRAPAGILVFYTFFAAIIGAYGLEYLKNNSQKFKELGKVISLLSFFITAIFLWIYVYANKTGFWRNILLTSQKHLHQHILTSLLFYDSNKLQQMFQGIVWNIVFVSISFLCTGIILSFFSKKSYQTMLILLLTTIGFLVVNPKSILTTQGNLFDSNSTLPKVLTPLKMGEYRILSIPVDLHQKRQHLPPADYFSIESLANLAMYQYDNNIERGLYQAGGYVSLVPQSYATFIGAKDTMTNVTNIDFSQLSAKQANLSSIRYITSHEPIKSYNTIPLQLVASSKNRYYIYENKKAFPRVYLLGDPYGKEISIKNMNSDNISFTVTTAASSQVIITDWYYPGWKADVNGKETPITSYLSTFQKISVKKGISHVSVFYDALSLKIGMVISFIVFLGWAGSFIIFGKKGI